ncbi:hypothetical protein F8388_017392 [Cannabis sativa]|uniref:Trafficking protein particle complex subunit 11 domain-containing protein n=1 Tax=Cannabis sativa TaxID=3483 RepID=A0A7J6H934_CANSA|nr:hypothetical protein F8388_017392 [Cannabis sativa]
MEDYPEEMRSPPVSLVSVAGCPDLHQTISTHLHSLQPPINTLALPDLSKISLLLAPNPKDDQSSIPDSAASAGILKRDWLLKHRTKIPAVVAALLSSDCVSGDPAQWLQLCSDLDNLKTVIRARNIRLVLVVVHSHSKGEFDQIGNVFDIDDITEDRMLALRKRAEIDSKYFITFSQNDETELKQSLHRLGSIFGELANIYYRDEGRRIKARIEKKSCSAVELQVRYCFKASLVAVYAEFRRDWVEAIRFYEDAYHTLREMIGTSTRLPAIQRLIEIKTVAEQVHFKISTLLLHGGKIIEAITWFRQHNASYRKVIGPPEAVFLHWEWMSRQFLVFAELLETSSGAIQSISSLIAGTIEKSLTEWEFRPANYYQLAAKYLKEKRSYLESAVSLSETFNDSDNSTDSVVPSLFVGQFARLIEQGNAFLMQPLTDDEYIHYAISEGKRFQDSIEIIALLKKSYESFSNFKVQRMAALCGFQMASEYYVVGDFSSAKQLFDGIANLYRQEGWVSLLWEVLGYLRECSRKQGQLKDFIEYSLEMAALPVSSDTGGVQYSRKECNPAGSASIEQKELIHKEVFELISGELSLTSLESNADLRVTGVNQLHLEIDLVSPLRVVLLASVVFHEHIVKPGSSTLITLSLLSQLPLTVEVDQLEVQFNQSACNFVVNSQRTLLDSANDDQQSQRVEAAPSLSLSQNRWLRLTYDIKSDQSGKLECISVIAKMGPHFTICCRAESPASMGDLPLWKFEDRVEAYPTKDRALAFTGQKATQVEEPDPQVNLNIDASGPAFVGESFVIPVTVASKGHAVHSGELKINLVDVRGGGLFSPRETEPITLDSHHVQLLGITGPEGEDESNLGADNIKKIQESFGLVSVPFLNSGDSWSCKLEIKWHRPKPVMLYASLAVTLPLSETSILVVSAKNCSDVPLQLISISVESDDDIGKLCSVQNSGDQSDPEPLVPGEEFKKVFSVKPKMNVSKLMLGSVRIKWRRYAGIGDQPGSAASLVFTDQRLPDVNLELSPLVVSLECPPYAVLGDPFTYYIKVRNQTQLLQELKLSLADAQSFVLSGSHNDAIYVLPKSEQIVGYKLVPLASGMQQLPRFTVTSTRYSSAFQPSSGESTIFVFPCKPHFNMTDVGDRTIESLAAAAE